MVHDQPLADAKAQAGSAVCAFGGEKGLKQLFQYVLRHPTAVIAHRDDQIAARGDAG
jgi:hypothetical protein